MNGSILNIPKLIYKVFVLSIRLALLILIFSQYSFSQNGFHRLFNERYGLNHKSINSIVKVNDGIVFLGTEKGLVKFDGLSFCDIIPNIKGYSSSEIISIKLNGKLLFLHYKNKGCLTYNLKTYEFKEIYNKNFLSIEPINENTYFILTKNGSLFKINHDYSRLVYSFGLNCNYAQISNFNNKLYVVTDSGLFKFNYSDLRLEDSNASIDISYNVLLNSSEFYLHLIHNNSVYVLDSINNISTEKRIILKKLDIPEKVNYFISESKNKYSYLYNFRKLVRGEKTLNDDLRIIHQLSSLDNLQLKNICIYNVNNVLIGTNQGLIWISKNYKGFNRINDNFQYDSILRVRRSILQFKKEEFILFGYPSIIKYNIKNNSFKTLFSKSIFYNAVFFNNKVYATTNDLGLVSFDKEIKNIEYLHLPKQSKQFNKVYIGLYLDTIKNILIAGGNNNLVFYDLINSNKRVVNIDIGLVKVILKDKINNIYWVGTNRGIYGIDLYGKIKFNITNHPEFHKKYLTNISDLLITNDSELWIANIYGIYRMNLKSLNRIEKIPIHSDLIANSVGLEQDNHGKIWISTFQGLLVYDPYSSSILHLKKDMHIINNEFNHSSSLKLNDGRLVFGGISGYDIVEPDKVDFITNRFQPAISTIFKISKDDTTQIAVDESNTINLNVGKEFLKIYVHIKNTIHDFYYNYEYSIDDNVWIKTNPISQILILDLSPGKHILKIRSLDNINNLNILTLNINATLPFYKTNLFAWLISILSLFTLILYVFTLRRIRFIKLKLKNQIAMDLHDEVGTVLTKALFHSRKLENTQLSNLIENALNSLRVYIYSMSNKRVKLVDLIDDVSEMLNFIILDDKLKVKFQHADFTGISISSLLYRDLKLSFFEIFANIQKHSHCTELEVIIENRKSCLCINFNDNGVLNDIDLLKKNGNGIENITKRILRHKGEIQFKVNELGSGLTIEIKVPYK